MADHQSGELTHVRPTATVDEVVAILRRDGAVIVEDMLPEQVFQDLRADLRVHLDAGHVGTPGKLGEYTRRCGSLMAKTAHTAELLTHPLLQAHEKTA